MFLKNSQNTNLVKVIMLVSVYLGLKGIQVSNRYLMIVAKHFTIFSILL